jgi:hypothetical protein
MNEFSHLSVLISIILGLAITQVLKGFRGILLFRARVRMYGPPIAWAWLLLIVDVQTWWAMFGLRNLHAWTFPAFSLVLLQTILIYMLAALVLPDFSADRPVDLRAHYDANYRWSFGLVLLVAAVSLCREFVVEGHVPDRTNVLFHAIFMAASVGAMVTRREWVHRLLPIFTVLVFGVYIAVRFARLR